MPDRSQNDCWSATARGLHWLMALLIGLQAVGGWVIDEMESTPLKVDAMTAHKSLGITLLLLLLFRLLWRWTHPANARARYIRRSRTAISSRCAPTGKWPTMNCFRTSG